MRALQLRIDAAHVQAILRSGQAMAWKHAAMMQEKQVEILSQVRFSD